MKNEKAERQLKERWGKRDTDRKRGEYRVRAQRDREKGIDTNREKGGCTERERVGGGAYKSHKGVFVINAAERQ